MGDVFYFNSPPEVPLLPCRREPKQRRRMLGRRPKSAAMNHSVFHAHVVRIHEPIIYAKYPSASLPQYLDSLLALDDGSVAPPESRTEDHAKTGENPSQGLEQDDSSSAEPSTSVPSILPSVPVLTVSPAEASTSLTRSQREHPRPVSLDLWQEEDGRRIRFALPDDTDEHVERLQGGSSLDTSALSSALSSHATPQAVSWTTPDAANFPRVNDPIPTSPDALAEPSATHGTPPHLVTDESQVHSDPHSVANSASQFIWDDRVLAVDDPLRTYDVVDFIDHWSGRCATDESSPITCTLNDSKWNQQARSKTIRRQDCARLEKDMQGLDWKLLGVRREVALRARELLHPAEIVTGSRRRDTFQDACHAEMHYKFRSFVPDACARFSHYQLRNMLTTTDRSNVFYGTGSQIVQTSLVAPSSRRTIMDLAKPCSSATPFKITCLASLSGNGHTGGTLIAGGFGGEYAVLRLASSHVTTPEEGIVSHARDGIVNHIRTFKDRISGLDRAAFSSNDCRLRIMDVQLSRFVETFNYQGPMNCSAMSPDGRLRALVHDGPETLITNAQDGSTLFQLQAHSEYAFACDWSACGRYLATGAEDRRVVVWDARNWRKPLQQLECNMSCARSVHFTDDGALVFAEDDDVVSIIDTRTFRLRQDIRFFGCIAGLSVVNGGEEIVVANADKTVGGLLSFQRVPQGLGSGTFGSRVDTRELRHQWHAGSSQSIVV